VLTPHWLSDGLAITMLTVAAYCASRIVLARLTRRATHYSVDAVHTAMGIAMAGMLTGRLASTTTWVVVFALAAGWFGLRAIGVVSGTRTGSGAAHLRHVVTSGAMVYMLVAAPTTAAATTPATTTMTQMGTGGAARFPTLALVFGIFMIGYTIMVTDRLSRPTAEQQAGDDPSILAPRTVACCQVAMNITMSYMLVTLL
jgi:hypothetical protein